ncbi:hypothetical protein ACEWK1_14040 [Metabacillus sp. YM-086]|uniref:hypothetical protein n=1 Tax=Metabacillus sp. YM-086 TaxID=3341729 RepID=UPI003A884EDE
MRYSNGFYLFHIKPLEQIIDESIHFTYRWTFIKSVNSFHCYSFSYYLTNKLFIDFDETNVWIDENRSLLIVFCRNKELLYYVFKVLNEKFQWMCIPIDLGIQSFLLEDGKSVITSLYNSSSSNRVVTSLIKTDAERIEVIEKLLDGDRIERNT